jgi:hypothetical protein
MTKARLGLLILAFIIVLLAIWLLLAAPKQVDMAKYAPADALLYLEANQPGAILEALDQTTAWKGFAPLIGGLAPDSNRGWLRGLVRRTGLGPIQSVVLSRAQVAVVLTELRTIEEGETLNIRPEGALLIETHTSEARIKPAFEEGLKSLANKTYDQPTFQKSTIDGVDFLEWLAPDNSRRIVGAVAGSLILIGTSEQAVRNCLAVAKGNKQSLKDDAELVRMRRELQATTSLTFGYVPPTSSARLLALGLPAMMGRAPGDPQFQRLLEAGAAKIFGGLGWSSQPYAGGIEDRYLIALQSPVGDRLKTAFQPSLQAVSLAGVIPADAYSATSYSLSDPTAAWESLKTTISSRVDTLSTVFFSSLLKSSLLSFGIDDPETFLSTVEGNIFTVRGDEFEERGILVARVRNRALLQQLISKNMSAKGADKNGAQLFEDADGELGASLSDQLVLLGPPEDIRHYAERVTPTPSEKLKQITLFSSGSNAPAIVTYTSDANRVRSFVGTVLRARGIQANPTEQSEKIIASLPYSLTETIISSRGIERTTRSPLGQFSTLFPLLVPEKPASAAK